MAVVIHGTTGIDTPDLDITGTGARIEADFSSATHTDRTLFQTSTVNGDTFIGAIPNGSAINSAFHAYNSTDIDNSSIAQLLCSDVLVRLAAVRTGSGAFLPLTFFTSNLERMRIHEDGTISVGSSSSNGLFYIFSSANITRQRIEGYGAGAGFGTTYAAANDTSAPACRFLNAAGTQVGSIATTGAATAYNTSSDYRLKENVRSMDDSFIRIAALRPVTFTWKQTGQQGRGFLAHELQEVFPQAVSGEKDAMNEDGTPAYQGVDASFLIADLVACIQEQQVMINELRNRVVALESR